MTFKKLKIRNFLNSKAIIKNKIDLRVIIFYFQNTMNKLFKSKEAISLIIGATAAGATLTYLKMLQRKKSEKFKKVFKLMCRRTTKLYYKLSERVRIFHKFTILQDNPHYKKNDGYFTNQGLGDAYRLLENDPKGTYQKIIEVEKKIFEELNVDSQEFISWMANDIYFVEDEEFQKLKTDYDYAFILTLNGRIPFDSFSLISRAEADKKIPLSFVDNLMVEKLKTQLDSFPKKAKLIIEKKGQFGINEWELLCNEDGEFDYEYTEIIEGKLKDLESLKENFENENLWHPWALYLYQLARVEVNALSSFKVEVAKLSKFVVLVWNKMLKDDVVIKNFDEFLDFVREMIDDLDNQGKADMKVLFNFEWLKK